MCSYDLGCFVLLQTVRLRKEEVQQTNAKLLKFPSQISTLSPNRLHLGQRSSFRHDSQGFDDSWDDLDASHSLHNVYEPVHVVFEHFAENWLPM